MSILEIMKKFNMLLSARQRRRIAELAVLMVIGGFLEMCSVSLILPFMSMLMGTSDSMNTWYIQGFCRLFGLNSSQSFLTAAALILGVVFIVKNLYLLWEFNLQYRFVYNNLYIMQGRLLDAFIHRPYEFFLKVSSGEMIRIIYNDTQAAFDLLVILLQLLTELVVSFMLIVTVFIITPVVTVCMAAALFLMLFVSNRAIKPVLRRAACKSQEAGTGMSKWLIQTIEGIKEVKVLAKEEYFQKNYARHGEASAKSVSKRRILDMTPRYIMEAMLMAVMFLVIAGMIHGGVELEGMIPTLSAVAMAAMRLLPSANRMSRCLSGIAYNAPMLDKLIETVIYHRVDREAEDSEDDFYQEKGELPRLQKEIMLDRVSYRYPDTKEDVLKEISMIIRRGEAVGIVGRSGAGKTTTVALLLGLLRPREGEILVDGVNIRRNMRRWLEQVGYIPQRIFMLDDSIRANIAFGESPGEVREEILWEALRAASLEEFVRSLPLGLDTQIGERGVRISGGQQQRIGIARALYRNPSVLIFDEATSALDKETELAVMESIESLRGRKTMIIVAHRSSALESCDHIFRVEEGKIIRQR